MPYDEKQVVEYIIGIDAMINWLEKSLKQDLHDKGTSIAGGKCPFCGGSIQISKEDDVLWIHDGGQGIDNTDPYIMLVIDRIRKRHPEWLLSSMCRKCNEEITFRNPHNCVEN